MKTYELSKYDFEVIDAAFQRVMVVGGLTPTHFCRIDQLKDKFAKAHTGWLEMEDEQDLTKFKYYVTNLNLNMARCLNINGVNENG